MGLFKTAEHKQLEKQYEKLRESFEGVDRKHARELESVRYNLTQDNTRQADAHARELENLKHEHSIALGQAGISAEETIRNLQTQIGTIEIETEARYARELSEAQQELARVNGENAGLRIALEEKDNSTDRIKEFMEVLLAKYPELDFSKLRVQFNLDAPVKIVRESEADSD